MPSWKRRQRLTRQDDLYEVVPRHRNSRATTTVAATATAAAEALIASGWPGRFTRSTRASPASTEYIAHLFPSDCPFIFVADFLWRRCSLAAASSAASRVSKRAMRLESAASCPREKFERSPSTVPNNPQLHSPPPGAPTAPDRGCTLNLNAGGEGPGESYLH